MSIKFSRVSFGYIKQPLLLIDINFNLTTGNLFVFGQKESGKTSLLELICGMQTLYTGQISVCDKPPCQSTNTITYLPAKVVALKHKSVLQNMQFACDAIGKDYSCINMDDEFIKCFGCQKFKKLSKYNQAIFALKRAEIKNAKILLLDVNLDGFSNEEVQKYGCLLQQLIDNSTKIVVLAISAYDFKKLQIKPNNTEIGYLYATKMYKFVNFNKFADKPQFFGMSQYLPCQEIDAQLCVSQNGTYIKVDNRTIKVADNIIDKIQQYFDEVTTQTAVKIFTSEQLDNLTDAQINKYLADGKILVYDSLSTELLN